MSDKGKEKGLSAYLTAGLMFPVSITVGLVIGYYLDHWLHTSPVLFLVFMVYGAGAGFYHVYKITRNSP